MPKRKRKQKRRRPQYDRAAWALGDPCIKCGWVAEPAVEHHPENLFYVVRCAKCGKYQKTVSETTMEEYRRQSALA